MKNETIEPEQQGRTRLNHNQINTGTEGARQTPRNYWHSSDQWTGKEMKYE